MEFTKDDLKIGYVVQFRSGDFKMVMNSFKGAVFMSMDGFSMFDYYKKDLTIDVLDGKCDVIKVWGFAHDIMQSLFMGTISRDLLWERKESKELTMQEIADKFGVDVKNLKIKK